MPKGRKVFEYTTTKALSRTLGADLRDLLMFSRIWISSKAAKRFNPRKSALLCPSKLFYMSLGWSLYIICPRGSDYETIFRHHYQLNRS